MDVDFLEQILSWRETLAKKYGIKEQRPFS